MSSTLIANHETKHEASLKATNIPKKVIFLELDVLICEDYKKSIMTLTQNMPETLLDRDVSEGFFFDPRCINWLNCIVEKTGARIVVLVTKFSTKMSSYIKLWELCHLPGNVIGLIQNTKNKNEEIFSYIEENNVDNYVVLGYTKRPLVLNKVYPSNLFGLQMEDYMKCVNLLKTDRNNFN